MTWEELVKKAKELGYIYSKENNPFTGEPAVGVLEKQNGFLYFFEDGAVETSADVLAENRTPDQMYQIMLALEN